MNTQTQPLIYTYETVSALPIKSNTLDETNFSRCLHLESDFMSVSRFNRITEQEAFEKCWAHSLLRATARRLFYIAIHQVSLLSHAATVARRLRIDVHNNINDNNDNNDNA